MIRIAGLSAFVLLAATASASAASPLVLNPKRTEIGFEIGSIGFGTTRGNFGAFDGRLALDVDRPQKSAVDFTVEAGSVSTGSRQLDDYIRRAFFDVPDYPVMSFRSSHVSRLDERDAEVTGDLTLHGVTRPVTLHVAVDRPDRGSGPIGIVAVATIKRSEFGMRAAIPIVSDDVSIRVTTEIEAKQAGQ